ncbi:MAG: hypothetical protein FWC53_02945 [Firmicutes bacterium]|nr:hypothetical protein [Bacillota bacterium]
MQTDKYSDDKEFQGHMERLNHISYMLDLLIDLNRSYSPYMPEAEKAEIFYKVQKEIAKNKKARAEEAKSYISNNHS